MRLRPTSPDKPSRGPSLRLAAMLGVLVLVLGAITQLQRPETHTAIARALGEPAAMAVADPPGERAPLLARETFAAVTDNAPFRDEETPAWLAVLAAVREAGPESLASESVGQLGYAALTSQPDAYRGRVATVAGAVHRVEEVEPVANELGVERLWRVTLQPAGGEVWPITLYTLEPPAAADAPYDASASGVFFKKLSYRWEGGVGSTPVLVAARLETTIAPSVAAAPVAPDQPPLDFTPPRSEPLGRALLAELGVDLQSLDAVEDKRRLTGEEAAPFYGLLGAVGRTPAAQLARLAQAGLDDYVARQRAASGQSLRDQQAWREIEQAAERGRYSAVPLFLDGSLQRGELVVLDAIVRRVVRVDASDSPAAAEAGLTHYYELEAFPEDSQNLPVVFVVRELPAGFPLGEAIRQPARLAGFYFKQWAYRVRKPSDAGDRRQFAPLLVGRAPVALAPPPTPPRPGLAIGVAATVALAGVAIAMWRLARRDRRYEAETLDRFRQPTDPDFGRLDELSQTP